MEKFPEFISDLEMACPSPETNPEPPSIFRFNNLPTEIREQIWEDTIEPRIVVVKFHPIFSRVRAKLSHCKFSLAKFHLNITELDHDQPADTEYTGDRKPNFWALKSITPIPSILLVCHESHEIAIKTYTKQAQNKYGSGGVWFGEDIDTLYVRCLNKPRHNEPWRGCHQALQACFGNEGDGVQRLVVDVEHWKHSNFAHLLPWETKKGKEVTIVHNFLFEGQFEEDLVLGHPDMKTFAEMQMWSSVRPVGELGRVYERAKRRNEGLERRFDEMFRSFVTSPLGRNLERGKGFKWPSFGYRILWTREQLKEFEEDPGKFDRALEDSEGVVSASKVLEA